MGLEEIRQIKTNALLPKVKKKYVIPKVSAKKLASNKGKVFAVDNDLENWFKESRKKLTGICQCGCGSKSQKNDDKYYKHSCCHLFPKSLFKSIKTHPLNLIERAFWGGCHSVLDDTSMERWVNFADWEDFKARFYALDPFISHEEKSHKFYRLFNDLVANN